MRLVTVLLFLIAIAAMPAHAATTDVHRCVGADGGTIFTDKKCEDIGASVRPAPMQVAITAGATERLGARGCARTADDLKRGLQQALATGDVNRVASFYHWPGIGSAESGDILKRLQVLAGRPLLSLQMLRTRQPTDADGYRSVASEQPAAASAVELTQARSGNDPTSVRTTLGVTHYFGCLWVHF